MSDPKRAKPARIEIPGLAYFTPENAPATKPVAKTASTDLALLEQMYGYFA
jgi:hypothetical protein